jgi:hypothetical protein
MPIVSSVIPAGVANLIDLDPTFPQFGVMLAALENAY